MRSISQIMICFQSFLNACFSFSAYSPNAFSCSSLLTLIARTDPNEQESVALLSELDGVHSG